MVDRTYPKSHASAIAPLSQAQVTLRIDSDVLKRFKLQGRGYQTHSDNLLRADMEAHL
ncbi:BrnA antitoxin family protein [Microcoleus sp. B3-A4]|uniref:BrnA antitoxin family protein n=1 Tax=Microcoleus sp. B3-A4 TaxID=2818653 RepID=UPI002FD53B44